METTPPAPVHPIDEISLDLFVYQNPSMLREGLKKLIDVSDVDKKALQKYSQLLFNIRYAWKKTLKYESYFSYFYPPDGEIDKVEALNHHIHAYLQDMDTFKNKIKTFLNSLKKDLTAWTSNKEDVKKLFKNLDQSVMQAFSGVSDARNPHTHHGMRFIDGDLLKAENAISATENIQLPAVAPFINQDMLPEFLEARLKEKEEGFALAQKRWVENAKRNNEQTTGLLTEILQATRDSLYQFLSITPTKLLFPK